MSVTQQKEPALTNTGSRPPDRPHGSGGGNEGGSGGGGSRKSAGAQPFRIYKPGQGPYVRWGTALAAGIISIGFANFLYSQLALLTSGQWVRVFVPVGALVGLAYAMFRVLGQNRTMVDFMIATEGEMKKVNWSTRREVMTATRVVIVTVFALGLVLFAIDIIFMAFFEGIGVLRIGMLARIFGGGAEQ